LIDPIITTLDRIPLMEAVMDRIIKATFITFALLVSILLLRHIAAQQPPAARSTPKAVPTAAKAVGPNLNPGRKLIRSTTDCDGRYTTYGSVLEINSTQVKIKELEIKGYPIVTYKWNAMLLDGQVAELELDGNLYLPSQVKVGDRIIVQGYKDDIDDNWYAAIIQICQRPGGTIPPSQKPVSRYPYHIVANYRQTWELEGIRMPDDWMKDYHDGVHPPPPKPVPLRNPRTDR